VTAQRFDKSWITPPAIPPLTPVSVRDRARREVASRSRDARECGELLAMLGLSFTAAEIAEVSE
jgi:hypothetical protein